MSLGFSANTKSTVKKNPKKTCFCSLVEGMLHGLVGFCFDVLLCRFKIGARRPREVGTAVLYNSLYNSPNGCFQVFFAADAFVKNPNQMVLNLC